MRVLFERGLVLVLVVLVALYGGDWVVYRFRAAHGNVFDTVKVNEFMTVPLKNGKEEMDYVSSQQVTCVRSLFPWAGDEPCWWVRRHADKKMEM